jgi:hypothetical protein
MGVARSAAMDAFSAPSFARLSALTIPRFTAFEIDKTRPEENGSSEPDVRARCPRAASLPDRMVRRRR